MGSTILGFFAPYLKWIKIGAAVVVLLAFSLLAYLWHDAATDRDAANQKLGAAERSILAAKQTNEDLNAELGRQKEAATKANTVSARYATEKQRLSDQLERIKKDNADAEKANGAQSASPIVDRTLRGLLAPE